MQLTHLIQEGRRWLHEADFWDDVGKIFLKSAAAVAKNAVKGVIDDAWIDDASEDGVEEDRYGTGIVLWWKNLDPDHANDLGDRVVSALKSKGYEGVTMDETQERFHWDRMHNPYLSTITITVKGHKAVVPNIDTTMSPQGIPRMDKRRLQGAWRPLTPKDKKEALSVAQRVLRNVQAHDSKHSFSLVGEVAYKQGNDAKKMIEPAFKKVVAALSKAGFSADDDAYLNSDSGKNTVWFELELTGRKS